MTPKEAVYLTSAVLGILLTSAILIRTLIMPWFKKTDERIGCLELEGHAKELKILSMKKDIETVVKSTDEIKKDMKTFNRTFTEFVEMVVKSK